MNETDKRLTIDLTKHYKSVKVDAIWYMDNTDEWCVEYRDAEPDYFPTILKVIDHLLKDTEKVI